MKNFTYRQCKYCDRSIISTRHSVHESKCEQNPHVIPKIKSSRKPGKQIGSPAWNKGLKKETNEIIAQMAKTNSQRIQEKIKNGTFVPNRPSKQFCEELSKRQSLKNSGGKSKWFKLGDQSVQGTYELQFAKALIANKIEWEKVRTNCHIFQFEQNSKLKSYSPDFWLPELELYIEIKGFWWGNDKEKMELVKNQNQDKKLILIFGKSKLDNVCSGNLKMNLLLEPVWSW